jgi:hypothetical protein
MSLFIGLGAFWQRNGALAESKAALDAEMATVLSALLGIVKLAVISGFEALVGPRQQPERR